MVPRNSLIMLEAFGVVVFRLSPSLDPRIIIVLPVNLLYVTSLEFI
jgi:hypothetical protein